VKRGERVSAVLIIGSILSGRSYPLSFGEGETIYFKALTMMMRG
jgi:hypothetical protein